MDVTKLKRDEHTALLAYDCQIVSMITDHERKMTRTDMRMIRRMWYVEYPGGRCLFHLDSETSEELPGEQELYTCGAATCDLGHIMNTFRGETEKRRLWENGGPIYAVAACSCMQTRHDDKKRKTDQHI